MPPPVKRVPEISFIGLQSPLPVYPDPITVVPLEPQRGLQLALCHPSSLVILDQATGASRSADAVPPSGTPFEAFAPFELAGSSAAMIAGSSAGLHQFDLGAWRNDQPAWSPPFFVPGEPVRCLLQLPSVGTTRIAIGGDSGLRVWTNSGGSAHIEGQYGRSTPLIRGPITAVACLQGTRKHELVVAGHKVVCLLDLMSGRVETLCTFDGHKDAGKVTAIHVGLGEVLLSGTFTTITPTGGKPVGCRRLASYKLSSSPGSPEVVPPTPGSDGFVLGTVLLNDRIRLLAGKNCPSGGKAFAIYDDHTLIGQQNGEAKGVFQIGALAFIVCEEVEDGDKVTVVRAVRMVVQR